MTSNETHIAFLFNDVHRRVLALTFTLFSPAIISVAASILIFSPKSSPLTTFSPLETARIAVLLDVGLPGTGQPIPLVDSRFGVSNPSLGEVELARRLSLHLYESLKSEPESSIAETMISETTPQGILSESQFNTTFTSDYYNSLYEVEISPRSNAPAYAETHWLYDLSPTVSSAASEFLSGEPTKESQPTKAPSLQSSPSYLDWPARLHHLFYTARLADEDGKTDIETRKKLYSEAIFTCRVIMDRLAPDPNSLTPVSDSQRVLEILLAMYADTSIRLAKIKRGEGLLADALRILEEAHAVSRQRRFQSPDGDSEANKLSILSIKFASIWIRLDSNWSSDEKENSLLPNFRTDFEVLRDDFFQQRQSLPSRFYYQLENQSVRCIIGAVLASTRFPQKGTFEPDPSLIEKFEYELRTITPDRLKPFPRDASSIEVKLELIERLADSITFRLQPNSAGDGVTSEFQESQSRYETCVNALRVLGKAESRESLIMQQKRLIARLLAEKAFVLQSPFTQPASMAHAPTSQSVSDRTPKEAPEELQETLSLIITYLDSKPQTESSPETQNHIVTIFDLLRTLFGTLSPEKSEKKDEPELIALKERLDQRRDSISPHKRESRAERLIIEWCDQRLVPGKQTPEAPQ